MGSDRLHVTGLRNHIPLKLPQKRRIKITFTFKTFGDY